MGDLPLSKIRDLTDPSAIDQLYALACEEDEKAQARLEEWHSEAVEHVLREVGSLGKAQLEPLGESLAGIEDGLSGPRKSAATISESIHGVVSVRARVESTAARIEEIIDIKNCMRNVRQAIDAGEYETAAASIFKYLQLDDAVLDAQSRSLLRAAQQEMKVIVNAKLDKLTGRKASTAAAAGAAATTPEGGEQAPQQSMGDGPETLLIPQPLAPALSPVSLPVSVAAATTPDPNATEALPSSSSSSFASGKSGREEEEGGDENEELLVRKYCKMCYQLGAEEEGVARYTGYLRLKCARKAEAIIRDLGKHMAAQRRR